MARPNRKLNESKSEVIKENFLQETPEGFAEPVHPSGVVVATHVPPTRRIQFLNGRDPGCELMFHYHSATHPLKHYTLFHGKEYDLPEEVIENLENCAENIYGYKPGFSGHPEMYVKSKRYVFTCKQVRKVA